MVVLSTDVSFVSFGSGRELAVAPSEPPERAVGEAALIDDTRAAARRHRAAKIYLRRMRIELDTRAAADALTDYLRRCSCIVTYAGERIIEAAPPPRSQTAVQGEIELDAYLRVWEALNPDGTVIRRGPRYDHASA